MMTPLKKGLSFFNRVISMTVPNDANTYLPPVIQIPSALEITNITRSNPMVITAVANSDQSNTYIAGQVVTLTVPITYGMFQANGLQAQILAVDGDDFTMNINSTQFDTFVIPSGNVIQPASFAPSGSRNLQFSNNTNQIAFQSLNNIGN